MSIDNYIQTLKHIKEEILRSRYNIAKVANKEMLFLYFKVGNVISVKVANEAWGSKTIQKLSIDLQNELKGLRGFSYANLKKMRQFYEEWSPYIQENVLQNEISSLLTNQLKVSDDRIGSLSTSQLNQSKNEISSLITSQFVECFTSVSFTAHYEILNKTNNINARAFYIIKSAQEFWTVETLKHNLRNKLFNQQKQFPNNFASTLQSKNKEKALASFRDQYLLDFISISDEEQENERVLENEIVLNIKKFLMSLGNDFAFIGNQYRLIVEEEEYFIDLLFFNRKLQALVAFELKTGKFKPEYLGKMNFYLSALDEYVKQEYEKPSIGIILCKEKKNKIVEFSFRDFDKAMGVATYSTSKKLPEKYQNILPDAKTLKKLMD